MKTSEHSLFVSNQRREIRQMDVAPAVAGPSGLTHQPFLHTSSTALPADSRARICQSPDAEPVWTEPDPASFTSSQDLPMSLFDQEDGCSLRTSPACFLPMTAEISRS